jgi:hypothetical protein
MLPLIGVIFVSIIAFILILVVFQPRRISKDFPKFYNDHALVRTDDAPPIIKAALGAEIDPTCWLGNLKNLGGGEIPFYWWQWYTSSRINAGDGSTRASYKNFLAVSFLPNILSGDFEQKAIESKQTSDLSQKFVNALVVDSRTPIRAEKLADGSFLIVWQVTEKAKVLKEKLEWLKANVKVGNQANTTNKGINNIMNYQVATADVRLTLMIMQPGGDFAPSSTMTFPYFFLVPETFAANLAESSKQLMHQIYDEHYDAFKLREPNDPNYIAVVDVTPKILTAAEYSQLPWIAARMPAWENSNCLVIQNNSYQKVDPKSFGGLLGLGKTA